MRKQHFKANAEHAWKKKLAIFLTSQTISLFGSSLVQYAIIWYVTLRTNSGLMVTLSTLFSFVPQILVSPFAGVWADRYSRKTLIIAADAGIAATTLLLAICFFTGHGSMWLLFIALAVRSFGNGIQTPAVSAFIPQLVPEEKLMRVNGTHSSLQALINLAAPAVGGIVLTLGALEYVLLIDVITAVIGIALFLCVPVSRHKGELASHTTNQLQQLWDGVRYLRGHSFIKQMIAFFTAFCLLSIPATMLNILFVTRVYDAGYWELSLNEIIFFVGMTAGGILMASWGGFRNRIKTIALGCFFFGLMTIGMAAVKVFWIYLVFMCIIGITVAFFNTPVMTLLQEKVEPEYHGRVFSLVQLIAGGLMPLGLAVFGPLADVVDIEWLMFIGGGLSLPLCLSMVLYKPFYRQGLSAPSPKAP